LTRWVWNGRERGLLHHEKTTGPDSTVPSEAGDPAALVTAESLDKTLSANTSQ